MARLFSVVRALRLAPFNGGQPYGEADFVGRQPPASLWGKDITLAQRVHGWGPQPEHPSWTEARR
jgi:hypothetical protein